MLIRICLHDIVLLMTSHNDVIMTSHDNVIMTSHDNDIIVKEVNNHYDTQHVISATYTS